MHGRTVGLVRDVAKGRERTEPRRVAIRGHYDRLMVSLGSLAATAALLVAAIASGRPATVGNDLIAVSAPWALIWVRHRPVPVTAVTVACATILAALGYTLSPLLLAPAMIALVFVALRTSPKTAYAATTAAIAAPLCAALIASPAGEPLPMEIIGTPAWLLLPVALGRASQLRLAYLAAAHARAEYAEKTKEEEARHRVADERMRIARELHDVIAHHLALANAQAGTVAYLMDTEPGKSRAMAGDLGGTIVAALEELKNTVGLLRQAGDPDSPLEPAPGLGRLPSLAGSFRSAGLAVTVTVTSEGEPRPLSPGTDLAAYRIIQEALTNVTKHATASQARVRLAYTGRILRITVTDDGGDASPAAAVAPGSGYGLIGMRERALSVGGRLRAGHRPAGGFEVVTELPLHPGHQQEDQNQ
jgi:signal transduction histidine kinase